MPSGSVDCGHGRTGPASVLRPPASLIELLRRRAQEQPDRDAYLFLTDGETETARLTWADVDRRARAIGAELRSRGAFGQRALITYPAEAGAQFLTALLGCLYAGAVAVPCEAGRGRAGAQRIGWVARDADPRFVLGPLHADSQSVVLGRRHPDGQPGVLGATALDVDLVPDVAAADWCDPGAGLNTLALLQYTSGSTGSPRGVLITHGNVLANEAAIAAACEHDSDSDFVGWLPLHHDMGLIANLLQPLYLGSRSVLMPPSAFLASPRRWLAAISRYRGVTSGGPNFAYDLCVARVPQAQRAGLDLSSWRVAFNGAEVVRAATLRRFAEAFGPAGFAPATFFPCYGLAEGTLIVSGAPRGVPPRTLTADRAALSAGRCVPAGDAPGRTLVSSGRPVLDTRVAIVDPAAATEPSAGGAAEPLPGACELPAGMIGEVWVAGPGVAAGYRGQPTGPTFGNTLPGAGAGFLRTGDLGAMVDGELYVVGRRKDVVIIRGRNHYPADLEHTAERAHPALRPSCGAAFAVDDGQQERLVLLYEVNDPPDLAAVAAAVRAAVTSQHQIDVHAVVLVARGAVPKTTSGKVRRLACRDSYLAGQLPVLDTSLLPDPPAEVPLPAAAELFALPPARQAPTLAQALLAAASHRLPPGTELSLDTPFTAAGLDSLGAVELQHRIEDRYQVRLPPLALLRQRGALRLAAQLLRLARRPAPPGTPAGAAAAEGPLGPSQRAIWTECQLAPPGPAYTLVRALRLNGNLDHGALDRAVSRLAQRHPALRTRFEERAADPVQVVTESTPVIDREDLTGAGEDAVPAWLAARAALGVQLLGPRPPVRLTLLRRSATEHLLVIAVHHILADFWSLVMLVRELGALYDSELDEDEHAGALAAPRATLIAHAQHELRLTRSPRWQRLAEYWRRRLDGAPAESGLPPDRPRPPVRSMRAGHHPLRLDAQLTAGLRRLAMDEHTTLHTALLAAVHLLLARHRDHPDVVIGTLAAGRDRPELAGVLGCLVSLVPVRATIGVHDSFRSLLRRVRADVLRDLAARHPFDEVVTSVRPQRHPGRPALVQTLLVLHQEQGPREDGLRAAGLGIDGPWFGGRLRMRSVAVAQPWTHLDLTFTLAELDGVLRGGIEYDAALFDAASIAALAPRLAELLRAVIVDPDRPLRQVALATSAERATALAQARGPQQLAPARVESLHGLVRRQVIRRADAVAVSQPGAGQLSYRALWRWSGQLAERLVAAGVRPGDVVAVPLPRCLALPAALLAVLRCGAAYLPLDPDDPPQRLAWLAADAGVRVQLGSCSVRLAPTVVEVAGDGPVSTPRSVADLKPVPGPRPRAVHPEQAAYVIHTSGSTGRPKGVVVPHRGIVNRLRWMQRQYQLRPADRVLHKAPTTFDVSLWELFWPLSCGARLVLAPHGAHRDPARLAELMAAERVSVTHFVPSLLGLFLDTLDGSDDPGPGGLAALRHLVCSGETLPAGLRDRAQRQLRARLHNLYGPTEASVDVTAWGCRPGDTGQVPIGTPIAGVEVHVLDRQLLPLPPQVHGELVIGGAALASGYLGRPGLTASVFVPHPHAAQPGARLYRTGDRGLRRPDGVLEFSGRTDHQVKIAGVRVELGEVTQALRAQPGVRDAAVVCHGGDGGIPSLIAFVVAGTPGTSGTADAAVQPAAMTAALRRLLPSAMVPAVLTLPALPTAANGKLDRAALLAAARQLAPSTGSGTGVAAGDSTERAGATGQPVPDGAHRRVARLWAAALGVAEAVELPVDQGFFALGGDSIRALRLVAALRQAGIVATVAELLAGATVRELAARANHGPGDKPVGPSAFALAPPLRTRSELADAYPLSMAQRAVLAHQLGGSAHEVYVTSVHVRGPFDAAAMQAALDAALQRHGYLRSSIDLTGDREPVQLVHHRLPSALAVHDLRGLPPAASAVALARWLRAERTSPIDIGAGPLLRCTVHRRDDAQFQLTLSSFALDGWCAATVLTELLTDHAAARRGRPSPLAAPRVGYAAFVELERRALGSAGHRAFWAGELTGAAPCRLPATAASATVAPVGRPAAGARGLTRRRAVTVDPELFARLRAIATALGVPLKSVLLAAHLRVVQLLSARDTVLTGIEVNGRPECLDGDRVVGVFNNIVPLRVPVAAGSWAQLIRAAAEAEHRVQPWRHYPFAQLEREHAASALFDSLFVFTHFHVYEQVRALDGVQLLGWHAPDQTYVALTAHFTVDVLTGQLRLLLDHDPARVTAAFAADAAGYHLRALAHLAADPHAAPAAAPLLTESELRRQQVAGDGGPAESGRALSTVHELVLRQAARTTDAVAVCAGRQQLSYRQLAIGSARWAAQLRAAGVGIDTPVGLPVTSGVELVVALLAILRAGGAYLPFDPAQPAHRVAAVLAGVALVAAVPGAEPVPAAPGRTVVRLGSLDGSIGPAPGAVARLPRGHPAGLAYVIPTSGTSGAPKLVGVEHRAVVNYLRWCLREYGPWAGRALAHSSPTVDLTVTALLAPLCAGATVRLCAAPDLGAELAAGAPGPLKITPAHLEAVGHQLAGTRTATGCVVVGGEQLRRHHLASWSRLPATVINEYGPTEATVGCLTHRVNAAPAGDPPEDSAEYPAEAPAGSPAGSTEDPVPIGRPIPGMRAVLAHGSRPVPAGVVAELHLGGVGLARGYLGSPGLTAACFGPDPSVLGQRLYRTGDLAWLGADGLFRFAGRADRQLTLRGWRIEPAEVEHELCRHPAVRQAAVVAAGSGPPRLLAYWVPFDGLGAGPDSDSPRLAEWLARRLPAHLVPAQLIRLPALPLTPHGKLDHAALADPVTARRSALLRLAASLSDSAATELLATASRRARQG